MKHNQITLVSLFVVATLYSDNALADLKTQCLLGVPHFSGVVVQDDINQTPVYIEADRADMLNAANVVYSGNVGVSQGNRALQSEHIQVTTLGQGEAQKRHAIVDGQLQYQDNFVQLRGSDAKVDLTSKDSEMKEVNYQFVGRQGRGDAALAKLQGRYRTFYDATFTSCLPGDTAWSIEANEIRQDLEDEVAEMWGARFKILGVPVLYTPYWQLPIGDRRRSGLLMPELGTSSRDGFIWGQPVYWNIAPNYDATVTPIYMSRRGLQMQGEFRYLTTLGMGAIAGEYLSKDRLYSYAYASDARYLLFWQHNTRLDNGWRLNVDYTRVSDKRYFSDFSSNYGRSTDGYATQQFSIDYYQPNYNIVISGRQFQVFDESDIGPYRTLPQIDYHYFADNNYPLGMNYVLYGQAVHFANDSNKMPQTWRFHLQPELNLPLSNQYAGLNLQTRLYATHYFQQKGSAVDAFEAKRQVTRILPQFKAELQTVLLNNKTFFDGYTQTFEPRMQYLYRPYKNQNDIGAQGVNANYLGIGYDSALLQQDYFSLFRDRRYSGLDRIASANQITLGGTTRLFDAKSQERFNLSLGQTYYLTASRIDDSTLNNGSTRSSWALESNWKMSRTLNWRGSYQYDTTLNKTSLANMALEYNPSNNNFIQLNYRYASKDYIDQNLRGGANRYNQDIKQIGTVVAWDINDNWAVVGKYYHDIALNKTVEQYAGIQYNTCCWNVTLGAQRHLVSGDRSTTNSDKQVFYDNAFSVNFQIRGLSSHYNSDVYKSLNKGLLPYIKPFSL